MKLSTVSIISAIAIFAATLPHGVGAWLIKKTEPVVTKLQTTKEAVCMTPKKLAQTLARKKVNMMFGKHADREWAALSKLWGKESGWNYQADNPRSSAYGIAQILGTPKDSTIEYQVNMGLKYIVHRYKKPSTAWQFWQRNGWY